MTTPTTTLKLMSTMALRSVLNEVIPDFEKQTGSTVEIKYGATAKLTERIRGGARGDIVDVSWRDPGAPGGGSA